jgi:D-alanyl-D-alanine carboxypeptidase/D-alanyl-D-alanine-endopeptidase (penicillin-binding protein 4)
MYCKGVVTVTVAPDPVTGAVLVDVSPRSTYYKVENLAVRNDSTAGAFTVTRNWLENGNLITVKGNVTRKRTESISLFSSRDFFMHTFVERLSTSGMKMLSTGYRFAALQPDHLSSCIGVCTTPMQTVLDTMMKKSDNLNAEAMLCRIAAQSSGKKQVGAQDGLPVVSRLISAIGHDPENYQLADGSGLSNYNYLSPRLLVDLLTYAYNDERIFQRLYKALPIAGVEGTLRNRMKEGTKAYRNVHAKSGSFTAINALAGYLKNSEGHLLVFAVMNQNVLSAARARAFQDAVCEILCD